MTMPPAETPSGSAADTENDEDVAAHGFSLNENETVLDDQADEDTAAHAAKPEDRPGG